MTHHVCCSSFLFFPKCVVVVAVVAVAVVVVVFVVFVVVVVAVVFVVVVVVVAVVAAIDVACVVVVYGALFAVLVVFRWSRRRSGCFCCLRLSVSSVSCLMVPKIEGYFEQGCSECREGRNK